MRLVGRYLLIPTDAKPTFTASGKMKRTIESLRVERQYRNVIDRFLAGTLPNFSHERHVHVANILHHLPYGRELMHLGLQTMAHRHGIPEKYRPDITDIWWERLDGTLPDPAHFADLPGGASGVDG
jgi:hypothetical protein